MNQPDLRKWGIAGLVTLTGLWMTGCIVLAILNPDGGGALIFLIAACISSVCTFGYVKSVTNVDP